jgi:hypothetical protein
MSPVQRGTKSCGHPSGDPPSWSGLHSQQGPASHLLLWGFLSDESLIERKKMLGHRVRKLTQNTYPLPGASCGSYHLILTINYKVGAWPSPLSGETWPCRSQWALPRASQCVAEPRSKPGVHDSPAWAVCTTVLAAWDGMVSCSSLFFFERREVMFISLAGMVRSLSPSEKHVLNP